MRVNTHPRRLRAVPRMRIFYRDDRHKDWPHVVKFSGGRSSALMLLGLLYARQLRASRGDVIVFNNTSAEHQATYSFAMACKLVAERRFNIPFFWTEFQTFEDARRGRWARIPSYRMVRPEVYGDACPDGYRREGEVFEELLSWKQTLPTRFTRHCTEYLKLHTTARFLEDWFGRPSTSQGRVAAASRRVGHWYGESRLDPLGYGEREHIVRFHLEAPTHRPEQEFQRYTEARLVKVSNPDLASRTFDDVAELRGDNPVEFVSLIGLRADEPLRVARVLERNTATRSENRIADGEFIYTPLNDSRIDKDAVLQFWGRQTWDLAIPQDVNLSNCVYCFMKGERTIREIAALSSKQGSDEGPESIGWWADIERRYARSVRSRNDSRSVTRFGFFGANRLEYTEIIDTLDRAPLAVPDDALPCDCTD